MNNPTVAFYQYYYLESGYDGGYMSHSTDNGSTWTQITNPTPAYNGYPSCFGGSINAYMGGPLSGWQAVSMTIPVSAGVNFKVRWLMGSESSVQYEGWLIDDVMYVGCFPLPAVTVTAPNGGELWPVNSVQTITWTNAGGVADRDSVWYSTNTGSSWTLITVNIPGTTNYAWTLPNIPSSANCLVKVKSSNAGGSNADSSNAVFTILNVPAPPTLQTPFDAVLISDATPDFTWSGPGDYYQLQVDDDPLFGSPAIDVQQPGTSYTPGSDIADGRWYWHVRSSSDGGLFYSAYSAPFYFDLDATLPLAPALYLPADNSYPATLTPTFNWGIVSFQNPGKGSVRKRTLRR